MSPQIKRLRWWVAVVLAATLPITFSWALEKLGGYVTEWMYYGNYRDLMSLVFLTTAFLIGWLMTKPSEYLGLRFTFAFVSIIVCLLAAIAPRPTCEEKIFFAAIGTDKRALAPNPTGCDG
ncbi:hypothetical protein HSX11_19770 [Oxalobacteraceae bacterium]|nr:hypothetical protein [Oxalobacteraceae bacterium]